MKTLLLEIGTEEIPAGYIQPALDAFAVQLLKKLDENRIAHGDAKTYGTPRRLTLMVEDVANRQKTITEDVMGPPERVAFDDSGTPLVPAVKFAEKTGIDLGKLAVKETDKGRYVFATLTQKGLATKTVLKKILPNVIRSLPFPKTMRWGALSFAFARPIQSVCALLGKEAVVFELADIKSNRYTFGHRFTNPGKIKLSDPNAYVTALEDAHVVVDIARRKQMIEQEIAKAANQLNGRIIPDEALVDTVTQLVEYPAIAVGTFEDRFLALPDEILITAMREHQKYFAVSDANGKLMAKFIVVNNTPAKDMKLVAKGHERVLRARLEDAMFFYKNDISHPFNENVEKLKGVLFQAKLGSMFDKTLRVQKLGHHIATQLSEDPSVNTDSALAEQVSDAAYLCKADLVSQVVVEFPKLQGIMGRIYAGLNQDKAEVASAIEDHYRPIYSGGELPGSLCGAVLAIADKMDSICGCFSVGLIPSGASDPYALRRQGIGIIQTLLKFNLMMSLRQMIVYSASLYLEDDATKVSEVAAQVTSFLKDRMANLLADEGYSKDVIASVIEVSVDCIPELWKKVKALENLKKAPNFEPLAIAFKRVANIIKKSDIDVASIDALTVFEQLFEDACEAKLNAAVDDVGAQAMEAIKVQNFDQALVIISTLRGPVDEFFDGVLVMAENPNVRNNRLALLAKITSLFETVADFSKIST